jgi:hypothetical protein
MARLARYGAELFNVALGLLAWLALTALALGHAISWHQWRYGCLLAASFVVLPLPLLVAHMLSPRLAAAMEPKPRKEAAPSSPAEAAEAGPPAKG